MARIWLHIGLHKTGTSALQSWCAEHADDLLEERILYVRLRKHLPACGMLAAALIRKLPEGPELVNDVLRQIEEHGSHVDDVVISSEDFSYFGPASIAPLVDKLTSHDVRMLVWLRRQDRYAEAMYKQTAKWNGKIRPIEAFITGTLARHMDYESLLQVWQQAFSPMTIRPQIYTETTTGTHPDSVAAFLTAIDRQDLIPSDSAAYRRNLSPSSDLIARYAEVSSDHGKALRQANRQLMSEFGDGASRRGDILSPEAATALMARYAASNARLAQNWFPEQAELFPADIAAEDVEPINASILERFEQIFAKKLQK